MTTTLERRFVDAIDHMDVPETDLVASVLDRIAPVPARSATPVLQRWLRRPVLALAALVIVTVIAVSAIAPARQAVANWLGIGATQVVEEDTGPLPTTASATALGEPVEQRTNELAPVPGLPATFEIFDDEVRGRSYTWASSANLPAIPGTSLGAVLSVRPTSNPITTKTGPVVESVTINFAGREVAALWIDGPHLYLPPGAGEPLGAAKVLVWEADDTEYRLESSLGLVATLALFS